MSQINSFIQSQLYRFQRFLNHLGYQCDLVLLKHFWLQTKDEPTEPTDTKSLPRHCSFICFHCCVDKDKKRIIKCKKSRTKSHRHRCSHSCSCTGSNHFHKTGISKMCTLNKPNQPLSSSDHALSTICGVVYDPTDPERPTINKWIDYLEETHGTSTNIKAEDDDSTSDSSDSTQDTDDDDDDDDDTDTSDDDDNDQCTQPTKKRTLFHIAPKTTPKRKPSPPKPTQSQRRSQRNTIHTNRTESRNNIQNMDLSTLRETLLRQRQEFEHKIKRHKQQIKMNYMHRINNLMQQQILIENEIDTMAETQEKRMDESIQRVNQLLNEQNTKKKVTHNIQYEVNKEIKKVCNEFRITEFKLDYQHHDVISFDGNEKKKRRKSRRRSSMKMNGTTPKKSAEEIETDIDDIMRRGRSAWNFFSEYNTKRLSQGNPGLTYNAKQTMSGKLWAKLKDKKQWNELEQREKKEREIIVYEFKKHHDLNKVPRKWRKKKYKRKDEKSEDDEDEDDDMRILKDKEGKDDDSVVEIDGYDVGLSLPRLDDYTSKGTPKAQSKSKSDSVNSILMQSDATLVQCSDCLNIYSDKHVLNKHKCMRRKRSFQSISNGGHSKDIIVRKKRKRDIL